MYLRITVALLLAVSLLSGCASDGGGYSAPSSGGSSGHSH